MFKQNTGGIQKERNCNGWLRGLGTLPSPCFLLWLLISYMVLVKKIKRGVGRWKNGWGEIGRKRAGRGFKSPFPSETSQLVFLTFPLYIVCTFLAWLRKWVRRRVGLTAQSYTCLHRNKSNWIQWGIHPGKIFPLNLSFPTLHLQ